jgi:biotin operon repressor
MTFLEKIELFRRVDQLIKRKATGTPDDLAQKLGVSRRCVFDIITQLKDLGGPVQYCEVRKSYFYEYECKFQFGFVDPKEIYGGKSKNISINFDSAEFLHYQDVML